MVVVSQGAGASIVERGGKGLRVVSHGLDAPDLGFVAMSRFDRALESPEIFSGKPLQVGRSSCRVALVVEVESDRSGLVESHEFFCWGKYRNPES